MASTTTRIDSKAYSIGELLRKPFSYRVPVYQRDFAWTSEQVTTFWDDIMTAREYDKSEYFLGAIVTSLTDDDKKRDIVDGQQRMTTISMIFAAISQCWRDVGDEKRSLGVFRDYLGSEDRRTGEVIPKITLNETNDRIYQSYVLGSQNISNSEKKAMPVSNRLLCEAFDLLRSRIFDEMSKFSSKDDFLIEIEEFLANQTNIIVIEAGDESDAFITFETLNDRGLDLAISDLVKNYLFSKADKAIDSFKTMWSEIVILIGGESMTKFLRYFWIAEHAEYEAVRERELYKLLRGKVRNRSSAKQMMESLRRFADYYAALSNPEHLYWADCPGEYRSHLEALSLFKVSQYRPVAMAAMSKLNSSVVCNFLKMLVVLSFRYNMISSLNTGNLDRAFAKVATAISKGIVSKPKQFFEYIKDVYPDDDKFETDFRKKDFDNDTFVRYVLSQINDHMEKDSEHTVSDKLTLEHILPQKPNSSWVDEWPRGKDMRTYIYMIGNLSLLERGKNRGVGNLGFSEKKEKAYSQSKLVINKGVCDCDKWTPESIEKRSAQFAKIARNIWRIDV